MPKTLHLFLLLFAITPYIAKAQGCEALIKDARTLTKNLKFDDAIKKVEAAKDCAAQAEIDKLYGEIFAGLKKQTSEANKAKDDATKAKERAEKAEKDAQIALADLQKALTNVVSLNLKEADKKIYILDYEGALEIMKNAAALKAAQKEVSDALLEIVFFFAETERFDRAKGVLDTAAQLAGRPFSSPANGWKKRTDFRRAIKSLNPERDTFLATRYFPVMLPMPGGTDTIGDIEVRGPFGYKVDEKHAVTLSPFKMAKTETTWWQYNLFCEATGKEKPEKPGWGSDGNNPVVNVYWYDAVVYANWLSEREGRNIAMEETGTRRDDYKINLTRNGYHLPTEAQWEYAARARTPFEYAGSNSIDSVAWCNGNSGNRTHPVAEKKANAFGLCDVSGNVLEWCWDWLADYDKNATLNPTGAEKGNFRVLRGGSWLHNAEICRVSIRTGSTPTTRYGHLGFRLSL